MMKVWKPTEKEIKQSESWGTWSKEESEFPWSYSDKETCYILEGQAEVYTEKGESVKFAKGDMVSFEKGLECTWKISKAIHKRYMFG